MRTAVNDAASVRRAHHPSPENCTVTPPPERPPGKKTAQPPAILESVELVFQLLDQLTAARRPLGVTDLALMLDEPKPRVYRHLASLRQLGVVEQDPISDKYALGAKLVLYGNLASEQFDLRSLAQPYLSRLRDVTGLTAMLSVPSHDHALVTATAESNADVCISVKPGTRLLAHSSAQGRVMLAFVGADARERILAGLPAAGKRRPAPSLAALDARLAQIRERLYDTADGEVTPGINALVAPLFRGDDVLVGTIGLLGTSTDIAEPPRADLVAALHHAAAEIGRHLNSSTYQTLHSSGAATPRRPRRTTAT